MTVHPNIEGRTEYEDYLVRRLIGALARAEQARTTRERRVHLLACRHYCQLLGGRRRPL